MKEKRLITNGKTVSVLYMGDSLGEIARKISGIPCSSVHVIIDRNAAEPTERLFPGFLDRICGKPIFFDATEHNKTLSEAERICEDLLKGASRRKILNEGVDIAIVGTPNAGKSSLLNLLLGQERAIVSDEAGTTRDVVKESAEYEGIRFNFLDTAGIRDGAGKVEKIGIERSLNAIESADIILFLTDSTVPVSEDERKIASLTRGKKTVFLQNKTDEEKYPREGAMKISAKTGEGIDELIGKLLAFADREAIYGEGVISNERHIYALQEALQYVKDAESEYDATPSECVLENVRNALSALGRITGKSVSESIVDEIFSRFCVGK